VKRPITNVRASVRQRLVNEAKRRGESFDYVASLYARERFLARLSASPHRSRLILKGASVMALWVDAHRTTRDLDFLGSGSFAPENAASLIREIVTAAVVDDGLVFDAASVTAEAIRDADEYRGARVHVDAKLDSARIRLQIDIAVGDVVTPPARTAVLAAMLTDFPPAKVKVYPPETIVAEKLHALVKLGIANSRMKDFYDLYILGRNREFDVKLLTHAVRRTFARRKTPVLPNPFALSPDFYRDAHKQTQWRAFLAKSRIDAPADFSEVGDALRAFLTPVLAAIDVAR
jgi:predicted nucleotidyltransferase component of viral defense system